MSKNIDDTVTRMLSEIAIETAWKKLKESGRDDSKFGVFDKEGKQECLFGYTIERKERIYFAESYVTIPGLLALQNANNKYAKLIKEYNLRFVPDTNDLTGQIFVEDKSEIIEIRAERSNKNKRNLAIGFPIETTSFEEYKSWISDLVNGTLGIVNLFDRD